MELVKLGVDAAQEDSTNQVKPGKRPDWLRIRLATPATYRNVKGLVERLNLNTVCQEARCPNIYECWGEHGTATFMILGDTCTRRCGFCAVKTGRPSAGVDEQEPEHVAEAVEVMGLEHAVITSVDRDDLEDGGAQHFNDVIRAVHERCPDTAVEVLTPDFRNVDDALETVLSARPEVFSHNMETVPRMYRAARPGSSFERSLDLLRAAAGRRDRGEYKDSRSERGRVKTSLMVGIGESDEELFATIRDIRNAGTDILTVGQYLQPTRQHLPVDRFVTPDRFKEIQAFAMELGFRHCEAGPLQRSSYHAHKHVG